MGFEGKRQRYLRGFELEWLGKGNGFLLTKTKKLTKQVIGKRVE